MGVCETCCSIFRDFPCMFTCSPSQVDESLQWGAHQALPAHPISAVRLSRSNCLWTPHQTSPTGPSLNPGPAKPFHAIWAEPAFQSSCWQSRRDERQESRRRRQKGVHTYRETQKVTVKPEEMEGRDRGLEEQGADCPILALEQSNRTEERNFHSSPWNPSGVQGEGERKTGGEGIRGQ